MSWDFDQSNGISPGSYDFVGAALHEITETVGRAILPTSLDLLNLFRYAAPGQFGNGLQQDYFSIDGGIHYDWSAIHQCQQRISIRDSANVEPIRCNIHNHGGTTRRDKSRWRSTAWLGM